jgi:DNA-binding CsgD family transcriptional regulator
MRADDHPMPTDSISDREREVLELIATGLTDLQVAAHMEIALGTVRKHVEHVRQKLGVHTRSAAIARVVGANATI